jgi:ribosomal protein L33
MHGSEEGRQIAFTLHYHAQQEAETEKLQLKKYNPALRRHTVHREIK